MCSDENRVKYRCAGVVEIDVDDGEFVVEKADLAEFCGAAEAVKLERYGVSHWDQLTLRGAPRQTV